MDLPSLTRQAFYAALPPGSRPGSRLWTAEAALIVLGLFIREEGAWPKALHLRTSEGLPSHATIIRLFGGERAWHRAYLAQRATTGEAPAPSSTMRVIACNRCARPWSSPDPCYYRTCTRCHAKFDGEDTSGDWMNGTPLTWQYGG